MAADDIRRDFPLLDSSSYDPPRSDEDFNYNCLAFALGDTRNWWEPPRLSGGYWPAGFPEDLTRFWVSHWFDQCDSKRFDRSGVKRKILLKWLDENP